MTESVPNAEIFEFQNEFELNANDVIRFRLVKNPKDMEDEDLVFYPELSHQIYGQDEKIVGYKNLTIDIMYASHTLDTYINMDYDEKYKMLPPDDPDPLERLTKCPIDWGENEGEPIGHSYFTSRKEFETALSKPFTPPGKKISSYKRSNGKEYEVYTGSIVEPDVKAYHERLQTFILFYIDASSYIKATDEKWHVYFLFEHDPVTGYRSIVGYTTVYIFYAHPHRERLRISQVFILPPFQRAGHGAGMLESIYEHCRNRGNQVVEISVEDPNDNFQALRDMIDMKHFMNFIQSKDFSEHYDPKAPLKRLEWSTDFWHQARLALKISRDQIRRCYEVYNLYVAQSLEKNTAAHEEAMKASRLDIKRRIYNIYDLGNVIEDATERKMKLQQVYAALEESYMNFLKVFVKKFNK